MYENITIKHSVFRKNYFKSHIITRKMADATPVIWIFEFCSMLEQYYLIRNITTRFFSVQFLYYHYFCDFIDIGELNFNSEQSKDVQYTCRFHGNFKKNVKKKTQTIMSLRVLFLCYLRVFFMLIIVHKPLNSTQRKDATMHTFGDLGGVILPIRRVEMPAVVRNVSIAGGKKRERCHFAERFCHHSEVVVDIFPRDVIFCEYVRNCWRKHVKGNFIVCGVKIYRMNCFVKYVMECTKPSNHGTQSELMNELFFGCTLSNEMKFYIYDATGAGSTTRPVGFQSRK